MRREKAAAEEKLPDMLNPPGIHADQQLFEVFDRPHNRQLTPRNARLTNARDPFIGIDNDKEKIALAAPNGVGLNIGNFHWFCS